MLRALQNMSGILFDPFPLSKDPPPLTPYDVIAEKGKVRLRCYRPGRQCISPPLLLVYPPIKRPYILDLAPGKSVVQSLINQGMNVYLTDWMPPSRTESWRGFDAYVNGDLADAVRAVQKREEVEQISLLGYSLGGVFAAIYAALSPRMVKNLIMLTAPVDTSVQEMALFTLVSRLSSKTMNLITATYGTYPAWLVNTGLRALALVRQRPQKCLAPSLNSEMEDYLQVWPQLGRWFVSDIPLCGQLVREVTRDILQHNLLAQNGLRIGGEIVNLKNITCPVFNIVGENDDLIPPPSSLPFIDLVGGTDKRTLLFPASHIGAVVGSAAHQKLWPQVGEWLVERSGKR